MERKAGRGGWTAGTFPYGYGIDAEAGHLVPRPDEAPLVARIFELYAGQRLGAKAVATELNAAGHRTRSGRPWSHMSVLTVLSLTPLALKSREARRQLAASLRGRRAELAAELDDDPEVRDVDVDHAAIKATLAELIVAGDRPTAKALLRTLVHEVRVESRQAIHPTFRVPTTPVRAVSDQVEVTGLEPATSTLRT